MTKITTATTVVNEIGPLRKIVTAFVEAQRKVLAAGVSSASDWAPMAKAQDGVLIIAMPRPTTILYVGDDTPHALEALRGVAREQMAGAPDALSDQLLRWTPEGWKTLP